MARYKSLEIIPRDVIVIGREAAMVWTINGAPHRKASYRSTELTCSTSTTVLALRACVPSGSAPLCTVSSLSFATPRPSADERLSADAIAQQHVRPDRWLAFDRHGWST